MSGHVILFEIQSNLGCCPLIILDLQQRTAVGATGSHCSILRATSLRCRCYCTARAFLWCSHIVWCNDIKLAFFSVIASHSMYEGPAMFLKTPQRDRRAVLDTLFRGYSSWLSPGGGPAVTLQCQTSSPSPKLLHRACRWNTVSLLLALLTVSSWLEHIDAWALETRGEVTLQI